MKKALETGWLLSQSMFLHGPVPCMSFTFREVASGSGRGSACAFSITSHCPRLPAGRRQHDFNIVCWTWGDHHLETCDLWAAQDSCSQGHLCWVFHVGRKRNKLLLELRDWGPLAMEIAYSATCISKLREWIDKVVDSYPSLTGKKLMPPPKNNY